MFRLVIRQQPITRLGGVPIWVNHRAASAAFLLLVACGGKASSSDPDGIGAAPTASVLFAACGAGCSGGLECVEGTCTRTCSEDVECRTLAAAAECIHGPTIADGGGMCGVPCRNDDACASLGAGSHCDFAFCVAGDLDALPSSFDELEVRRVSGSAPLREITACDPSDFTGKITVSPRRSRLTYSSCAPSPNGAGWQLDTAGYELDEAGVARVHDAYRRLRLSETSECSAGAQPFAIDIEVTDGPEMLFADVEHSACPLPQLQRYSFVAGANALYDELLELTDIRAQ